MSQNHHDQFSKDVFSRKDIAVKTLKIAFPKKVSKILDLDKLRLEKGSFVEDSLKGAYSDLLFTVPLKESKNKLQVYILMEHKSYPSKNIHKQLLKYLSLIYAKQKKKSPVIPFVFYHGKEDWLTPLSFLDTFGLSKEEKNIFSRYIPNFEYILLDLKCFDLDGARLSKNLELIFKSLRDVWFLKDRKRLFDLFRVSGEGELNDEILGKIFTYLYFSIKVDLKKLNDIVTEVISEEAGGIAMSTAEVLIEKGIEKGIEKEKVSTAQRLYEKGVSVSEISEITGLSLKALEKIGIV